MSKTLENDQKLLKMALNCLKMARKCLKRQRVLKTATIFLKMTHTQMGRGSAPNTYPNAAAKRPPNIPNWGSDIPQWGQEAAPNTYPIGAVKTYQNEAAKGPQNIPKWDCKLYPNGDGERPPRYTQMGPRSGPQDIPQCGR